MFQIKGKKIKLRDFHSKDKEAFLFWNTGAQKWMDFDGPYYKKLSPNEVLRKIQLYLVPQQTPRKRLFIVNLKTDELIGMVSCYWQSKETNWMSIGVTIFDEKNWNKGLGKEALSLWITYLFEQLPELVRLDLRTWSGNIGMIRLAEKLNFTQEACFRKARIVNNEYYDGLGYGILREEWYNYDNL